MWTRHALFRAFLLLNLPLAFALAQEPTASLRGTVTDSIRHRPLAGATVVATRTTDSAGDSHDYSTTTDAKGRYTIPSISPGSYVLTVEHPWLDSTGLGVPAQTVDLRTRRNVSMNLAVPSGATIRAAVCASSAPDSTVGLVAGYLMDAGSQRPVAGARVVFVWSDFDVDPRTARETERQRTVAATTARDGTFRMCGLPVMRPILMQAQVGDRAATGAVALELPASGVLVESLRIEARPVGFAELSGVVQRTEGQRPLGGAHVHLYGAPDSVTTAEDGSFHLRNVPLGTQSIEVTALGFYPRRYSLDVEKGATGPVTITMSEIATMLDSVRIIARRTNTPPWYAEFDDRSAHGFGQYITEKMIYDQNPSQTSDMLRTVSGFRLLNGGMYSSRGITTLSGSRACAPIVLVDGTPQDMNNISPFAIHGIEVYASGLYAPAKYSSGDCGVILIWTK